MVLRSTIFFLSKMHINASNTLSIEEITILHKNIKTPLMLKSDDSRTKVNMKCNFQALLEKSISYLP